MDVHSAPRSQRSEPAPGMRDDETRFSDRDSPLPHESTDGCAPTRLLVAHTFLPLKDKVAQSATRAPATAPPAPATPGANRPLLLQRGLRPGPLVTWPICASLTWGRGHSRPGYPWSKQATALASGVKAVCRTRWHYESQKTRPTPPEGDATPQGLRHAGKRLSAPVPTTDRCCC